MPTRIKNFIFLFLFIVAIMLRPQVVKAQNTAPLSTEHKIAPAKIVTSFIKTLPVEGDGLTPEEMAEQKKKLAGKGQDFMNESYAVTGSNDLRNVPMKTIQDTIGGNLVALLNYTKNAANQMEKGSYPQRPFFAKEVNRMCTEIIKTAKAPTKADAKDLAETAGVYNQLKQLEELAAGAKMENGWLFPKGIQLWIEYSPTRQSGGLYDSLEDGTRVSDNFHFVTVTISKSVIKTYLVLRHIDGSYSLYGDGNLYDEPEEKGRRSVLFSLIAANKTPHQMAVGCITPGSFCYIDPSSLKKSFPGNKEAADAIDEVVDALKRR